MEADNLFSDDDSFFSLTSIENSKLKDMRRGWNNRASALGTDETIIIDAENDLNLQENEELLNDDEEDNAKPPQQRKKKIPNRFSSGIDDLCY